MRIRSALVWSWAAALVLIHPWASRALAADSPVRDGAGIFGRETVRRAVEQLDRIERAYHVPVIIETIDSLEGQINVVAARRHRQAGALAVYLLIARENRRISPVLLPERLAGRIPTARLEEVRQVFIGEFKRNDFNAGLEHGIAALAAMLEATRPAIKDAAPARAPATEPTPTLARAGTEPRRLALLVGINAYQKRGFPDLEWAENDVEELHRELQRIGFDKLVVMKGSAQGDVAPTTPDRILAQLDRLLADVGKHDIVLVALCGHGQQLRVRREDGTEHEDGFFCPVNAVLNDPKTMLSLSFLTDKVLQERGGKNLVLIDACRDGVVEASRAVRSRGIEGRVVSLPENTAILFSCASGQTSIERNDLRHGVFTLGVLETIRATVGANGVLTWSALVTGVQDRVAELNPGQEPIAAGAIGRVELSKRSTLPGHETLSRRPSDRGEPSRRRVGNRAEEGSQSGEERDDNELGMKFGWCPPGWFRMGSPPTEPERSRNEGPVRVTLSHGFWIGKFEVTQEEWRRVMGTTIRDQAKKLGLDPNGEGQDHPIYYVSYTEARDFCRKLTEKERAAGRLPADRKYELPTEAQWEYACRAGTTTATAFGDRMGIEDANFIGPYPLNGHPTAPSQSFEILPVGSYKPNRWGFFDMHGNVSEWCLNGYTEMLQSGIDPVGLLNDSSPVIRGGSVNFAGGLCRSAARQKFVPQLQKTSFLGFRVARVPTGP